MSNITLDDLITNLHSPDPDVRMAAAEGLGQYAAYHADASMLPTAVPHLIETLHNDPARAVRLAAAYSLGALHDARAVPALIDVLRASEGDRGLQLVVAKALGKLGDPLAVPALLEALQGGKSWCVSVAAAKALERIGTPEALTSARKWRSEQRDHHE